jgi:hypothetical protein
MCKWGTYKKVKLARPKPISGRTEIFVDECISPLVQALNDAGIETEASCCGHNKGVGNIALSDGRELFIIANFDTARFVDSFIHDKVKEFKDAKLAAR